MKGHSEHFGCKITLEKVLSPFIILDQKKLSPRVAELSKGIELRGNGVGCRRSGSGSEIRPESKVSRLQSDLCLQSSE